MNLEEKFRHVYDFPKKGIDFIDITPVLAEADAFCYTISEMARLCEKLGCDVVVSCEARGFILGAAVSYALKKGFVPARKAGKLPYETISCAYGKEYDNDVLQMHKDAVKPGQKVVILDDVLATGGTALSAIKMVEQLGGEVTGCVFLVELSELNARSQLAGYPVETVVAL